MNIETSIYLLATFNQKQLPTNEMKLQILFNFLKKNLFRGSLEVDNDIAHLFLCFCAKAIWTLKSKNHP